MSKPSFVYVTYIRTTPEKLWAALTDPQTIRKYWFGITAECDWQPGSPWAHVRTDGSGIADVLGTVVEADPPTRLVTTWAPPDDAQNPARTSRVAFDLAAHGDIVRLTVRHTDLADHQELADVGGGWPAVLSNLKSLLETGSPLPQAPWEMHGAEA